MASMKNTTTTGMIEGTVMVKICFIRLAPSIEAASYNCGLIPAMAARYTIEEKPISFHTLVRVRMLQKYLL